MTPLGKMRGRTVLVTGGCGFIGSHLVRALVDGGAGRVVVLDSLRYGDRDNLGGATDRVEVVPFTLGSGDPSVLEASMEGVDYLFHLAAEKHNQSRESPLDVMRANVEGTLTLLDTASRLGVRRAVFASSLYAYGRMGDPPFVETETPEPRTIYGISKLCGEHLLAHYTGRGGMEGVVLRFFFVYGPRQYAGTGYRSVIVRNFERILGGDGPTVYGDGKQAFDYVYVDDVVRAAILAMESDAGDSTLNVGTGVPTTVDSLIDTMIRVSGRALGKTYLPPDWTAGSRRVADITKIREVLGWAPVVPLDEGLGRTWRWMQERARDAR